MNLTETSIVDAVLEKRGLTRDFLGVKPLSDPEDVPGLTGALGSIRTHLSHGSHICIYGDYDVDGMTGTTILLLALREVGANVTYYIPSRKEGYGLNQKAIDVLSRMHDLIITVDCGITSTEISVVDRCDLIITDHHERGEELPVAASHIVHPGLNGGELKYMCGAFVSFQLAKAILGGCNKKLLMRLARLAAVGTVADVVPLIKDNRSLVKFSLEGWYGNDGDVLSLLLDGPDRVTAEDVAFKLGPRLNAIGRLDDAMKGVELLAGNSFLVQWASKLNEERKEIQKEIVEEATEQIDPEKNSVVVCGPWNKGVIGIVAGRIAEKEGKPTVVLSEGEDGLCSGSARSAKGIALNEAFQACHEILEKHGGHAAAAGLTVRADKVPEFMEAFEAYVTEHLDESAGEEMEFDLEMPVQDTTLELAKDLDALEPFGEGNREVVFLDASAEIKGFKEGKSDTLFLEVGPNKDRIVGFGWGERFRGMGIKTGDTCRVYYVVRWSTWNGADRKDLRLKGIEK